MRLIRRTDKREPAIYDFLQKRVFYRLTSKGKTEVKAWEDPIAVTHPEFR
jgi:DNA-binding PadR family transcriptional regulator